MKIKYWVWNFTLCAALFALSCNKDKCDEGDNVTVRITNNTLSHNIAVKLPNLCWATIQPPNIYEFTVKSNENATFIAFTSEDDSLAYVQISKSRPQNWKCELDNDFVKPPKDPKLKSFSFTANTCTDGIDCYIDAEDAGSGTGIRSVQFKKRK